MRIKITLILLIALTFSACSGYNRLLRNPDPNIRFAYAQRFFEEGRYNRTIALLEDVIHQLHGTARGEEALFLLGQSFFNIRDFTAATATFRQYYAIFPAGQFVEDAMFNAAFGMYLDSPDPRLDQTSTYLAIEGFMMFRERFPQSDRAEQAMYYVFYLQEKLAYKELLTSRLYLNLGNFAGNNHYEAAVITAREAMRNYPFSVHLEEFQMIILRARFRFASQSFARYQQERFRTVIDEFHNYRNMFPEGRFMNDAVEMYTEAARRVGLAPTI